ncbi:MAG: hypothetical protein U0Q04_03605 [Microbacterium sp.]
MTVQTTTSGSLPRTQALIDAHGARTFEDDGFTLRPTPEVDALTARAVADVVARQRDVGITLVGDGEFGKAMTGAVDYGAWWSYSFQRVGGLSLTEVNAFNEPPVESSPGHVRLTSFLNRRDRQRFPAVYADAVETGGLKATATSVVGTLYAPEDAAGCRVLALLPRHQPRRIRRPADGPAQSTLGFRRTGLGRRHGARTRAVLDRSQGSAGAGECGAEPGAGARYPADRHRRGCRVSQIVALVLVGVVRADNLAIIHHRRCGGAITYFAVILSSRLVTGEATRPRVGLPPAVRDVGRVLVVYQRQFTVLTVYSSKRLDRDPLRLGDAGVVGQLDQSDLHHRAVRRLRHPSGPSSAHASPRPP